MPLLAAYAQGKTDKAQTELLDELLPARFAGFKVASGKQAGDVNAIAFEQLKLQAGTRQIVLEGGFDAVAKPLGKGQVVIAFGSVLRPGQMDWADARQKALAAVCKLVGATYTPPQGIPPTQPGFGTMALVAATPNVTVLPAYDNWDTAWEQFAAQGVFCRLTRQSQPRRRPPAARSMGRLPPRSRCPPAAVLKCRSFWRGVIPTSTIHLRAGNNRWHERLDRLPLRHALARCQSVIHEAAANLPIVRRRTESFRKTFYDSTLPYWLLDCITSQAATIRHIGVVFRIANGDIYGWEGSNGCCQPTCTHVWGYEQSLSRLFPDLEKEMRRIDFKHQQYPGRQHEQPHGFPSPPHPTRRRPGDRRPCELHPEGLS